MSKPTTQTPSTPEPPQPAQPTLLERLRAEENLRDPASLKQLAAELLKPRWREREPDRRRVDPTTLG
jgi:hypothetical protein